MVAIVLAQTATLGSIAIVHRFVMLTMTAVAMAPPQTIISWMDATAHAHHILASLAQIAASILIAMQVRIAAGMARPQTWIPLMAARVIARKVGLARAAQLHQSAVAPRIATVMASLQIEMPPMVAIVNALVATLVHNARMSQLGTSQHGAGSLLVTGGGEAGLASCRLESA